MRAQSFMIIAVSKISRALKIRSPTKFEQFYKNYLTDACRFDLEKNSKNILRIQLVERKYPADDARGITRAPAAS